MRKLIDYRIAGLVLAVAGAFSTQACDDKKSPLGDLAAQCGLVCSDKGIVDGNASISGIAKIDAFFGSVVNFNAKANLIAGNIDAELAKIKLSVGLNADDDVGMVKAAMIAKFKLDAKAGVKIAYKPAECAVSAKATIEATAKCEGKVEPGTVAVECKGSCEADASASATCDASADVKCVGTAPNLQCSGECKGTCELKAAAACSGTCHGECSGTCSAKDAMGQCQGSCDGMCQGSCEMAASAHCDGSCKGECTYTPPDAKCDASASVKCEAKANASVMCNGKCDGEVTPPKASAECKASAKADASLNVECTPPSVDVSYQFDASLKGDAQVKAQAEFEAFLIGFKASLSNVLAQLKQSDVVLAAGIDIGANGVKAVNAAAVALQGDASLKVTIGVGCAIQELDKVGTAMKDSTDKLKGSVSAAGSLTGQFTG